MFKINAKEILIYYRANNTENTRYVVTFSWAKAEGENFLDKGFFTLVFKNVPMFSLNYTRLRFPELEVLSAN